MSWALVFRNNSALLGTLILLVAFSGGALGAEPLVGTVELATPALSGGHSPVKQVTELLSEFLGKRGACAGSPSTLFLPAIPSQGILLQSPPPAQVAFRIASCRWDPVRKELQFYLRCSEPGTCRPFLATLRGDDRPFDRPLPSTRSADQPRWFRRTVGGSATASSKTSSSAGEAPLVRAGDAARLDLTGPGVHIRLAVTCLERGALGQQIRARVTGESKVLLAKVTGPQILAAELP